MKRFATLAVLLAASAAFVTPAGAALNPPTCINARLIDKSNVVDTHIIRFTMKDHKVYQTKLKGNCMSLKFFGYVFVTPTDEVCNGQSIRVLKTDQVCVLGPLELQERGQHI
ncbi:MAG TPA: hypothetical protein VMU08_00630 [Rhizomicrobium sp.]|nr:hypothetical protein [Rhizomicrobium sp.]